MGWLGLIWIAVWQILEVNFGWDVYAFKTWPRGWVWTDFWLFEIAFAKASPGPNRKIRVTLGMDTHKSNCWLWCGCLTVHWCNSYCVSLLRLKVHVEDWRWNTVACTFTVAALISRTFYGITMPSSLCLSATSIHTTLHLAYPQASLPFCASDMPGPLSPKDTCSIPSPWNALLPAGSSFRFRSNFTYSFVEQLFPNALFQVPLPLLNSLSCYPVNFW